MRLRGSRWRLPLRRGERRQVVAIGHRGQAREHVLEVGVGVDAAPLAGDHDRVDNGRAVTGVGMPYEKPVVFLCIAIHKKKYAKRAVMERDGDPAVAARGFLASAVG